MEIRRRFSGRLAFAAAACVFSSVVAAGCSSTASPSDGPASVNPNIQTAADQRVQAEAQMAQQRAAAQKMAQAAQQGH